MNTSDISTITGQAVAELKQSRISSRASLFPGNVTDPGPENTDEVMDYSPDYKVKLLEECYLWRETYDNLKDEFLKWKTKATIVVEADCIEKYENYIARLKHLTDLVRYMSYMHDDMIIMRNKKINKLKTIVCEKNTFMNKHLNL